MDGRRIAMVWGLLLPAAWLGTALPVHADEVNSTLDVLMSKCWSDMSLTPVVSPARGLLLQGRGGATVFSIAPADVPAFQRKLDKDLGDLGNVIGPDRAARVRSCMAPYLSAAEQALAAPQAVTDAPPPSPTLTTAVPLMPAPPAAAPMTNTDGIEPEPGALGRLVTSASLLNDATWTADASRINRQLKFGLHVEASGSGELNGLLNVTLSRDGKDVCTLALNSRTSYNVNGVRKGETYCADVLPANVTAHYRARISSSAMTPLEVTLTHVDASRR